MHKLKRTHSVSERPEVRSRKCSAQVSNEEDRSAARVGESRPKLVRFCRRSAPVSLFGSLCLLLARSLAPRALYSLFFVLLIILYFTSSSTHKYGEHWSRTTSASWCAFVTSLGVQPGFDRFSRIRQQHNQPDSDSKWFIIYDCVTLGPHHFPDTSFHRIVVLSKSNFAESLFCPNKKLPKVIWPNRHIAESSN